MSPNLEDEIQDSSVFGRLQLRNLEEQWRARLQVAGRHYNLAAAAAMDAMQTFRERTLPAPDGGLNVVSALRGERGARQEYMRLLRTYTDLVVSGKMPEEK